MMTTLSIMIPDRDPVRLADGSRLPIFWRNPNGWVLRLAYRLWLVKRED